MMQRHSPGGIALPDGVTMAGIEQKQDRLARDRYEIGVALQDAEGHAGDSILWVPLERATKPELIALAATIGLSPRAMRERTKGKIVAQIMETWTARARLLIQAPLTTPERAADTAISPQAMADRRAEWESVVGQLGTICQLVIDTNEAAIQRAARAKKKGRPATL